MEDAGVQEDMDLVRIRLTNPPPSTFFMLTIFLSILMLSNRICALYLIHSTCWCLLLLRISQEAMLGDFMAEPRPYRDVVYESRQRPAPAPRPSQRRAPAPAPRPSQRRAPAPAPRPSQSRAAAPAPRPYQSAAPTSVSETDFLARIRAMVAVNEGRRARMYIDSRGHPTIGIGYNLDANGARAELASMGLDYAALRARRASLTEPQIDALFTRTLTSHLACARQIHPRFSSYPMNVRLVATDMTFNMGCGARWPIFIRQLEARDYAGAARNMRGTPYCRQVGDRCTRNMALLTSAR